MNVSRTHKEWGEWELAIVKEELALGSELNRAQIVRRCRERLKDRSESSIANKLDQLRKAV